MVSSCRLHCMNHAFTGEEVRALGTVTRGIDIGNAGTQELIDHNTGPDLDTGALQEVCIRLNTGCHDNQVCGNLGLIIEVNSQAILVGTGSVLATVARIFRCGRLMPTMRPI